CNTSPQDDAVPHHNITLRPVTKTTKTGKESISDIVVSDDSATSAPTPLQPSNHEAASSSGTESTLKPKDSEVPDCEKSSVLSAEQSGKKSITFSYLVLKKPAQAPSGLALEWSRVMVSSAPSTIFTSVYARDMVPTTLMELQEFHFSRDLSASKAPNSPLLGSDILLVLRTYRSLDICPVPVVSPMVSSSVAPLQSDLKEDDSDEDLASVSQMSVQGSLLHSYRGSFPEVSEKIGITHKRQPQPPFHWYEHPWRPPPMPYVLPPCHIGTLGQPVTSNSLEPREPPVTERDNHHHPPPLQDWNLR
ncbi:hypothetical protein KIL84_016992, partial [Mauremys mutica]